MRHPEASYAKVPRIPIQFPRSRGIGSAASWGV